MTFLGRKVAVAIPDAVLEDHDSPREKAAKLGTIARNCAIYGVDLVEVYGAPRGKGESKRIVKVLRYLETPQYLRKRIYPIDEDLRFAGILPPLRTPSHKPKVALANIKEGEIREGITNADGTVDIGLDSAPLLRGKVAADRRKTVRIVSKSPFEAEIVGREEAKEYWGYQVEEKTIDEVLRDERFPLKIATSRLGDPMLTVLPRLRRAVGTNNALMLLFGAPSRGLFELVGPSLRGRVDFVVNLFAEQHVETVRTEEAISAALNLLNVLSV